MTIDAIRFFRHFAWWVRCTVEGAFRTEMHFYTTIRAEYIVVASKRMRQNRAGWFALTFTR